MDKGKHSLSMIKHRKACGKGNRNPSVNMAICRDLNKMGEARKPLQNSMFSNLKDAFK